MSNKKYIFPKSNRLKSRKKLQQIFAEGKSARAENVRIVYLVEKNTTTELKCGVGLTTKFFKNAVDRNRIKRLLREAYRLQQQPLLDYTSQTRICLSIFILFTGKELPTYAPLYDNVGIALRKLVKTLHATGTENT